MSSVLPEQAILFAPAKLTVELRVTGVRDDGMHLIDAEMVSLSIGDQLQLAPGNRVEYRGAWEGVGDGTDLVSQALAMLNEQRSVVVDKQVPAGAGLGGGSSDAAAILRAGGFDDVGAAAKIGADVAFCLAGGRARVRGIGEIVDPLPFVERTYTLLTPPVHCSTPEVYRRWDAMGGPTGANGNDLEPAALEVAPALKEWRDRLSQHTGTQARLAGSGSTWFVEGSYPGDGVVVATTVAAETANG